MIEDTFLWKIVKKSDDLLLLKENSIKEQTISFVKNGIKS